MRLALVGVFAFVLALPATAQQPKLDPEVASLVESNSDFAANLYQQLASRDGNLFFSPYSISNALAMTYGGAKGNTANEMKTTLRFQLEPERLHPTFGKLILALDGDGKKRDFQLNIANRLWGQKDYGFLPDFTKLGQTHYNAGLEEVDFINKAEEARQTINTWVEKKTNDKIKNLIPAGVLTVDSRLVLTNAIYFKAPWSSPFDPKQTRPGKFQLLDGKTAEVPMMHMKKMGRFAAHDGFSVVEMPYGNMRDTSMIVILPKEAKGLADVEKRLTAQNLAKWTSKMGGFEIDLKIPKFKMTLEISLKETLQKLGMKDAFAAGTADFSGIATREKLFITAVLHKAFVDVNEAGTEAAAATAVVVGTTSLPPSATFHADRPFLFLIRDNRTGSVLFLGRVVNPT
jgi:serine protease inhibitor